MMQALPHAWLPGTIRADASSESCLRWLASVVEDEGDVGSARRMTVRMAVMLDSVRSLCRPRGRWVDRGTAATSEREGDEATRQLGGPPMRRQSQERRACACPWLNLSR